MFFTGLGDAISANIGRSQSAVALSARRLSSGLRIESAADDPSGLAIAESLKSRVAGLQQSVENVQTGSNLLTVGDGALATILNILQRVRSLIVESASDINSDGDLANIQTEIGASLLEINRIAANANFNGVHLFDGSHDDYVAPAKNFMRVQQVNVGLLPDGTAPTGSTVYDASNSGTYNPAPLVQNFRQGLSQNVEGFFTFEITGYSSNPVDPNLGPLGQPGVYLENDIYSTDPQFSGNRGQEIDQVNAVPTGAGPNFGSGGSVAITTPGNWIGYLTSTSADFPNISAQDVGTAIGFVVSSPRQSGGGTALDINDAGSEGGNVAISLPTISTRALDISSISVLRPGLVDQFDNPIGQKSSNDYAIIDAETRVDNAIEFVLQARARIGAQTVAISEDAGNDSNSIVNLQQSESSIRDLDVANETITLTKNQILQQVGVGLESQIQADAKSVLTLFAA